MSQLSEFRRTVLKKSQQALAEELGYENWKTYAAQELGKNPMPPEIRVVLKGKKYKFDGLFPDEENQAGEPLTRDDFLTAIGGLELRLKDLEGVVEDLAEGLYAAIPSMPRRSRRAGRSE